MKQVKDILKAFSERPIAYQPIYAKITGSITSGILLSQIVYWWHTMREDEFYKTDEEWCDELSMGLYELKSAKKRLQEMGIITLTRKGVPAKTYYELDEEILITLITSYGKNPQLDVGKTTNKSEEKPTTITIYTENTTETTTENNSKAELCDNSINSLMDIFYQKINPMLNFGNKTERKALQEMIDKFGYEKVRNSIEYAMSIQSDRFAPVITTPCELKKKMGQLVVYMQKQNNNNSSPDGMPKGIEI